MHSCLFPDRKYQSTGKGHKGLKGACITEKSAPLALKIHTLQGYGAHVRKMLYSR
jgi:hypothetical protein